MDSTIITNGIKTIIKLFGKNIKNGIAFQGRCMTAEKNYVSVEIDIKMNVRTPFILPMDIAHIISDISNEDISVKADDKTVTVFTDTQNYQFERIIPADTKPHTNIKSITTVKFNEFKHNLSAVLPVAGFSHKYNSGGVILTGDGQSLTIAATNGYCFANHKMNSTDSFRLNTNEYIKKLTKLSNDGDIKIYTADGSVIFAVDNCRIFARLIEAKPVDISKYLNPDKVLIVDRKVMLKAASNLVQSKPVAVTVVSKDDYLLMSMKTDKKIYKKIPVKSITGTFKFALNPLYLKYAFKAMDNDDIQIGYNEGGNFIKVSDDDKFWIIMAVDRRKVA